MLTLLYIICDRSILLYVYVYMCICVLTCTQLRLTTVFKE